MSEYTSKVPNAEPGAPDDFNPDAISGEELRKLREEHARNMGANALRTPSLTEQRYKAESEARGGRPYFPPTPPVE